MRVSYNKLWKLLIDKNMKKMDLLEAVEMSPNTLAKLGRNEDVSMDVLKRICAYLKCDIGDIMEMIPEKEGETDRE
jgi:DNA-binding Xre family transcriptional regulator